MAWLSGWAKRRKITIDNTNIDSDLTHFPVPVPLGTAVGQSNDDVSSIFTELDSSSLKIAITKSDGTTQIYAEVEQWDSASNKALLWVSKSDLTIASASVTELYIYYDSSQADNTTYIGTPGNRTEVWDSDYIAVYTLAQDPTGGTDCIIDSTGSGHHGTPEGSMTSGDLVDGLIGRALDFDGSDDQIRISYHTDFNVTGLCIETFHKLLNTNGQALVGHARAFRHFIDSSEWRPLLGDGNWFQTGYSGIAPVIDAWQYSAMEYDGDRVYLWTDAVSAWDTDTNDNKTLSDNTDIIIGEGPETPGYFTGLMQMVLLSSAKRSDAWKKTFNYAQTDNLLTWGAEEETGEVNTFFMFPF